MRVTQLYMKVGSRLAEGAYRPVGTLAESYAEPSDKLSYGAL